MSTNDVHVAQPFRCGRGPSTAVYRFTVLTPTYNRAHTLPRVYRSLDSQTFRDFEWLVVDDGSSDGTADLVAHYRANAWFPVRYIYQEHGHKKKAFNRGVREARGELLLCLDSDDEITPNALETLERHWRRIPDRERDFFCGVTGLCVDTTGKVVGDRFPVDVLDSDYLEVFYRYHVVGEKWGFTRTDLLRRFPFTEEVTGHVPEGVVWSAIAARYKTRFVNEVVRVYHYEEDSITRGGPNRKRLISGHAANADGHALWAREVVCNQWQWFLLAPVWFVKMGANYTRFHLHMRSSRVGRRWRLRGWIPRLIVAISWPIGVARYYADRWSARSAV